MKIKLYIFVLLLLFLLSGMGNVADAEKSNDEINLQLAIEWVNIGVFFGKEGMHEEELAAYDKALELSPQLPEAWFFKGLTLHNLKRYEEALIAFDKTVELNPRLPEAWAFKGEILKTLGRYEEALIAFDKALELNPQLSETWAVKGDNLMDMGRYEEALIAFDKALELNPQYLEAWINKGVTLGNLERYEEALIAYNKALELNPKNIDIWFYKGVTLKSLGRNEEALIAFDKIIVDITNFELNPHYAEAWAFKGEIFKNMGRYEEALIAFDKALEVYPQYTDARNRKAEIIQIMNKAISIDVYIEPSTGQILNRLDLSIQSLLNFDEIVYKPKNIKLSYYFEGIIRNDTVKFINNSYNIDRQIKVDLIQRNDYPFEDYNSIIYLSTQDENFTNSFFINTTSKEIIIDSWGQARVLNFTYEGNKIEIRMDRVNKTQSVYLYATGLIIILFYILSFIYVHAYKTDTPKLEIFTAFAYFNFVLFVTLTIAGIRDYLFISKWANLFIYLIILFTILMLKISYAKKLMQKTRTQISTMKTMFIKLIDRINNKKQIIKSKITEKFNSFNK